MNFNEKHKKPIESLGFDPTTDYTQDDIHLALWHAASSKYITNGFDKNNVFTYPGEKRDSGVEDATIVATHMILAAADLELP